MGRTRVLTSGREAPSRGTQSSSLLLPIVPLGVRPSNTGRAINGESPLLVERPAAGLSTAIVQANVALGEKVDRLSALDIPSSARFNDEDVQKVDAALGALLLDDLKLMMRNAGSYRSEKEEAEDASALPPVQKAKTNAGDRGKDVVQRKKAAAPRPKAPESRGQLMPAQSASALYVQRTLAELRADPDKMQGFAARINSIVAARPKHLMRANKAAVSTTPEQFRIARLDRLRQSNRRADERRLQYAAQRAELEEQRRNHVLSRLGKWEGEHAARLQLEANIQRAQRQSAWLVALHVGGVTRALAAALEQRRELKRRFAKHIQGAKKFLATWRIFLLRRRLKALTKVRRIMRRRFFFWRMKRNIEKKRNAAPVIISWLRSIGETSAYSQVIRRFTYSVRKVQRSWRLVWAVIQLQAERMRVAWIAADEKRGLSHGAAVNVEKEERELRQWVIRDDIRQRKAQHLAQMLAYRREKKEFEEWEIEQEVINEARRLVNAEIDPAAEAKVRPTKPIFSLLTSQDQWLVLNERVKKRREQLLRAKDKEATERYRAEAMESAAMERATTPAATRPRLA